MTPSEALERLLKSYRRYYNIRTEDAAPPFAAEAVFHSHDEQYFLVKAAKLAEAESNEYIFFAVAEELSLADVRALDEQAWVKPHSSHRNSDVALILLAERIGEDAKEYIRKCRRYRSYRFTLQGWSHYQLIALETSTGTLSWNRRGRDLRKLFRNILK